MANIDKNPTNYFAHESLNVDTNSTSLTAATFKEAGYALITVAVAPVRFWLDGTAPTATVGHILGVGSILELDDNRQLDNVRFISETGVTAILSCSYGN